MVAIIKKPDWILPEHSATSEHVYINRRQIIKGVLAFGALGAVGMMPEIAHAERNPKYTLNRPLTPEKLATTYTNYYEFGSSKNIWKKAQKLKINPWDIEITGLVQNPQTIAFDDLVKQVNIEERLYRLRCVEAWAMRVPWTGFQFSDLLKIVQPKSNAKYIVMETFERPREAKGQLASWYPWPYIEGITMEEAKNELAFLVTGMYGKDLPKQNGAPLRLALPWKYGFKSIKGLVKFTFTDKRPISFWEQVNPNEYGFWANVNPKVDHPRWSQATERDLETGNRHETEIYNGYGKWVAGMYEGMKSEKLFM